MLTQKEIIEVSHFNTECQEVLDDIKYRRTGTLVARIVLDGEMEDSDDTILVVELKEDDL